MAQCLLRRTTAAFCAYVRANFARATRGYWGGSGSVESPGETGLLSQILPAAVAAAAERTGAVRNPLVSTKNTLQRLGGGGWGGWRVLCHSPLAICL